MPIPPMNTLNIFYAILFFHFTLWSILCQSCEQSFQPNVVTVQTSASLLRTATLQTAASPPDCPAPDYGNTGTEQSVQTRSIPVYKSQAEEA